MTDLALALNHWPARLESAKRLQSFGGCRRSQQPIPVHWRIEGIRVEPGVQSKATETFPPIGSVPLIPMDELDSAWVQGPQRPVVLFLDKYEPPTADRGSHGAPWLCQRTLCQRLPRP